MLISNFIFINAFLYGAILFISILSFTAIKLVINNNDCKQIKIISIICLFCISSITVFNFYYILKNNEIHNIYSKYTKEEMELYTSFYLDYNQEQRDDLFLIEMPLSFISKEKGYSLRLNIENLKEDSIKEFEDFCTYNQLPCQLYINKDEYILLKNDLIVANGFYKEKFIELPYLERDKNVYKKLQNNGFNVVDYGLDVVIDKKYEDRGKIIKSNYLTVSIFNDEVLNEVEKSLIYELLYPSTNQYDINVRVVNEETKEMIDNFKLYEFEK